MVEMADIQVMTEKATPRSLIIIDELGRGTSTSEGMAIAQSVIEYVHDVIGCKALVSTHFHELAHLEESLDKLANYSMAVQESGDKVNFLRKLIAGAASSSYGIYCARLAGLPDSIIERANGLLHGFEQAASQVAVGSEFTSENKPPTRQQSEDQHQSEPQAASRLESSVTRENPLILERNTSEFVAVTETATGVEHVSSQGKTTEFVNGSSAKPSKGNRSSQGQQEVMQLSIFDDEEPATVQPTKTVMVEDKPARALIRHMRDIDVMNMTPLQAMQILNELKLKAQQLS
jgi:DNA mismatch repair protein MutS